MDLDYLAGGGSASLPPAGSHQSYWRSPASFQRVEIEDDSKRLVAYLVAYPPSRYHDHVYSSVCTFNWRRCRLVAYEHYGRATWSSERLAAVRFA